MKFRLGKFYCSKKEAEDLQKCVELIWSPDPELKQLGRDLFCQITPRHYRLYMNGATIHSIENVPKRTRINFDDWIIR